jgi:hypothetical protein
MQSITEQSSPSDEYLSDYAYIDTGRLSHYYAQLSKHGLVTHSKHLSKTTGKDTGKLAVKAMVVSGEGQIETGSERALELHVDASFSRPQETLDALYAAGFIADGISNSPIGSLVLTKGRASIFDVRILKEMWTFIAEKSAHDETAHIQNHTQRAKEKAAKKLENDINAQIVSRIPHSVQGTFVTDEGDAWFTLQPEFMRMDPADIVFKHGCDLPGEWHVLSILDALPDSDGDDSGIANQVNTELESAFRTMLQMLRITFGRPTNRYGITPIMIFRTTKLAHQP